MTCREPDDRPRYSFVLPVYNEEETLERLFERLAGVMDRLDGECEAILIDDGSRDASYSLMKAIRARDRRFKVVRFSRNFGHQIAVTAGLDFARGDAVVLMDADLQDPPEVVQEMVERWKEGYEVVYGVRERREGESWFKRCTAGLFYRVLRRLSDTEIPLDAGDFRLVDRKVVETIKQMPESNRFLRGMFSWVGYRQTGVTFRRPQRCAGVTKYPLRKMLTLAADGLFGFSRKPLRLPLRVGALLVTASIVYAVAAVALSAAGRAAPAWAAPVAAMAFLGGIQLIALGVVGAYLMRTYDEVRGRPLYIVSQLDGLGEDPPAAGPHRPTERRSSGAWRRGTGARRAHPPEYSRRT